MAKIIKKILYYGLIPLIIILMLIILIIKLTNPNWTYKLTNDYYIRKTSNQNVELSKKINNKYYTKYKGNIIGVSSYVAEFQYNDDFIGIKTIEILNNDTTVNFYLVDTNNEEVKGPYTSEETYLAVVGVWSKKPLGNWITTTTNPNK